MNAEKLRKKLEQFETPFDLLTHLRSILYIILDLIAPTDKIMFKEYRIENNLESLIHHDMCTRHIHVQVFDQEGYVINPAGIQIVDDNTIRILLDVPESLKIQIFFHINSR